MAAVRRRVEARTRERIERLRSDYYRRVWGGEK